MTPTRFTVHKVPPQDVFTRFWCENPEAAMQEFRKLFEIAAFANALFAMQFSVHKLPDME